jgi:hypothetical protein
MPVIAYTISSLTYLPNARVLARTYAEHHPGERLWVLLIDDVRNTVQDQEEPFLALRLSDLDLEAAEIHRMALLFRGNIMATIKPWVFQHFLSKGAEMVLYIDSDFMIFETLSDLAGDGGDGVVLVPHVLTPVPRDGMQPDETTLLGSGMFNAGMFGVGNQHGGFVEFLMERLRRECIFDPKQMRFNEQRWLDFVPAVFPHRVVKDPGVDVAYWNLHERPLEKRDDRWFAGGVPLRAFHFSSFEPHVEGVAGRYELATPNPRVRADADPLFRELCGAYRRMLYAEGLTDAQEPPFSFDMLPDGSPVYGTLRELFRSCVLRADSGTGPYPPDPFNPLEADAFRAWAVKQYAGAGVPLPRKLSRTTSRPAQRDGSRGGWLSKRRRIGRSTEPEQRASPEPTPGWAIEILDRMVVAEAGEKRPTGIEILPERSGFICHGPRAPLFPGRYHVTLELDAETVGEEMSISPLDQALVVEAFVQGFSVGSSTATFSDIATGTIDLGIEIPGHLRDVSLLLGLELRILTRGRLRAYLRAIVLEPSEGNAQVVSSESERSDWLPIMAGGNAGLRVGGEVVTLAGLTGLVVVGPNWRMPPGRYHAMVRIRMADRAEPAAGKDADDSVVVRVEAMVGNRVLAEAPLTSADLARDGADLHFEISADDARPDAQVGIRVSTLKPIDAAVTSVEVARFSEPSPVSESVA